MIRILSCIGKFTMSWVMPLCLALVLCLGLAASH